MAEPSKLSQDTDRPPQSGGIIARALAARGERTYLAGLNPEQRLAVETLYGPVLVLAGAGTGKTRVLTTRIAHILNLGRARPAEILAVTFTNKAAREMKARISAIMGEAVEGMPWLGTFHAIGVKILRRHAELVGLKPDFTILDTDDQIRLLKQLLEAENIDEKRWPARVLATLIDGWKNRGLAPDKVPAGEAASFAGGRGAALYAAYQDRLKVLNAVDFGDLLLECIRLFRERPEVLRLYQERFRFVLVDEYQDTNVAQYLWLRLIGQRGTGSRPPEGAARLPELPDPAPSPGSPPASAERFAPNICCVGDDDQSIYGWRGAEVDNILRFENDFPGAKVIRLERNYRSTGHILATASHLIAHNEGRLGKTLRTEDEPGEKVTVTGSWDSEEEARAVGEEIEQLQRAGHPLNEIAILVRASFQMREFEDRFVTLGLPYRVIGGPRFYERAGDSRRARLSAPGQFAGRRPRLRAHRQRPQARPRRRDPAMPARARARETHPPHRSGAGHRRDRGAQGKAAHRVARPDRGASTAGAASATSCPIPSWSRSCSTSRATPTCGNATARPTPPDGWKTSRSSSARWRSSRTCRGFSSTSRW